MIELKVAMVGAGNMIEAHIRAFQSQDNVKVIGITNRTREKAERLAKEYNIAVVADDIATLMNSIKPDLVVMAVYEPAILKTAIEIFAHNCAVLMEKPLGLNLTEAEEITALAEKRAQPVFVGLNRRAMDSTHIALEDLNSRDEPRFIHIQDQQSLATARAIGHVEMVVENWMYANSVHLVDYVNTFGRGQISDVKVLQPWTPKIPGTVLAHITFSSGDTAIYEALWNGPGPWSCTVSTQSKRWEMRPLESASYQSSGTRALVDLNLSEVNSTQKPGFLRQAYQVCCALRGEGSNAVTASEALKSVKLVKEIYS